MIVAISMTRTAASVEGGSPEVAGPSAGLVPKGRPEPLQESALRRRWQLARWILDPTGFLREQVRQGKDSFQVSVFGGAMGCGSVFLLTEPKSIQALMSRDTGSEFSSPGELNLILAPLLGVRNTILLSGAAHRQRRQLVMPRFHGEHLPTDRAFNSDFHDSFSFFPFESGHDGPNEPS